MIILGIETSCDETAAAIVKNGTEIISNVVASSQSMHAKFGGIIPEQAAREQIKAIIPVIHEAIAACPDSIDAIGVTVGPGLIGSLLVGVETAKTLSLVWNKPLIPVNHLIGHVYANWLPSNTSSIHSTNYNLHPLPSFPAIILIVSGGHTELVLMENHGKFKYLGGTRDDAAGECFDKCARLLGLGYPGGPAIENAASQYILQDTSHNLHLPRPLLKERNFDFSFSGLKTAVASVNHTNPNALAFELQEAISDVLVDKTLKAAEKFNVKSILLAGGVAANKHLRKQMELKIKNLKFKIKLHVPPIHLCTDNAAYIASAAYFNQNILPWQKLNANPSLDII